MVHFKECIALPKAVVKERGRELNQPHKRESPGLVVMGED